MSFTIGKSYRFDAAHSLDHLPDGHKCKRLHGHTYEVTFVLAADTLEPEGWVRDYGDLKPISDYIATALDHRNLNDEIRPSTAENLAYHLFYLCFEEYPELVAVEVRETPNTFARYSRDNDGGWRY